MTIRSVCCIATAIVSISICSVMLPRETAFANDSATTSIKSDVDGQRTATLDQDAKSKPKSKSVNASAVSKPSGNGSKSSEDVLSTSPGVELANARMKELIPLLDRLKKRAPHQYEKAIRDLDRSAKRLEAIRKRDEKLFEASMREWTTRSEIQLRKAKLRVANTVVDAEQLEKLQRSLINIQIERLKREIELSDVKKRSYEDRIKALERQLNTSSEGRRSPAVTKKPSRDSEKKQPMDNQKSS
jgi:hypothetical protein